MAQVLHISEPPFMSALGPALGPWAFPEEVVEWRWVDGKRRHPEEVEEALRRWRRHEEARRREEALEQEHARQRRLWEQHWEGVEGRRMKRADDEGAAARAAAARAAAAARLPPRRRMRR